MSNFFDLATALAQTLPLALDAAHLLTPVNTFQGPISVDFWLQQRGNLR